MFEVGSVCRLTFFDDKNQSHELHYDGRTKRAHLSGWKEEEEEGFLAEMSVPTLDMVEDQDQPQTAQQPRDEFAPLVVPFSSRLCDDPSLTGGKGASLGDFISVSQIIIHQFILILGKLSKMENVTVPRGFCLTKIFFEKLIDEELLILLRELEETSRRELCERLATCCDNVQTKIKRKRLIFLTMRKENMKNIKTSKNIKYSEPEREIVRYFEKYFLSVCRCPPGCCPRCSTVAGPCLTERIPGS